MHEEIRLKSKKDLALTDSKLVGSYKQYICLKAKDKVSGYQVLLGKSEK